MFEIIELLANLIDQSIMLYVTDKSFKKKDIYNIKIILLLIVFQSLFMRYTNVIFGNGSSISSIINIVIFMFTMSFFYKYSLKKVLVIYSFLFLIMLIVEGVISTFMNSILNAEMTELLKYETIYRVAATVISKAVIIICIVNISNIKSKGSVKNLKYFPLISIMLVVNIFLHLFMLELYTGNIEKYLDISIVMLMFFILINTINVLSFFIIIKIVKYLEKETRWKMTEKEYERQIEYFKNYNQISTEIKQLKHDLSKHFISLGGYLDNGDIDDAKSYIAEVLGDYKDKNAIMSIKNKIIGSILNYKLRQINENNIIFKFYIDVPEKVHIKDVDLTIILSNILDNAVEACQNMPLDSQKEIELIMEYDNNKITIRETNTFKGKLSYDKDKILTSKTDECNHGFGLENIKKSTKKYNGSCTITTEKNNFIIEIDI